MDEFKRLLTSEAARFVGFLGSDAVLATHWPLRILTVGNYLLLTSGLAQKGKLAKLDWVGRGLVKPCLARRLYFFSPSGNLLNIALRQVGFRTRLHLSQGSFPGRVSQPAFFLDSSSCSAQILGSRAMRIKAACSTVPLTIWQ